MNDRYLFKAKRIDWQEWAEEYQWFQGNLVNVGERYYLAQCRNNSNELWIGEWVEVDPTTLCQCTGLTDKNGTLIWENDIVNASCSEELCAVGKVEQKIDGTWIMYPACRNGEMWYLLPDKKGHTTVDVSGNIFDNPELLEVEC